MDSCPSTYTHGFHSWYDRGKTKYCPGHTAKPTPPPWDKPPKPGKK